MAEKFKCEVCGYIYDTEKGMPEQKISPQTPFAKLPGDCTCPSCGVAKEHFIKSEEEESDE